MVEVQNAVTERDFMPRPNQLHQVDICRRDASQIWNRQNHCREFSAAYAWELE